MSIELLCIHTLVIPEEPEDSLDIEVDRPMERIEHEKERRKGRREGEIIDLLVSVGGQTG